MIWTEALKQRWLQHWQEGADVAGVPWVATTKILILQIHIPKHLGYVKLYTEKEVLANATYQLTVIFYKYSY